MSAEEFGGLGFVPGVVKGVRSFAVDKFGRLTGIHYKQVWRPGENLAECLKNEPVDNPWSAVYQSLMVTSYTDPFARRGRGKSQVTSSPKEPPTPPHVYETCTCGFYGYFDGSDDYHTTGTVTAVVEAYGETVIGTRGFRAMKARIAALRIDESDLPTQFVRKIRNNYDGVAFFDDFERMVAAFPPDQRLEPSPATDPEFWERKA